MSKSNIIWAGETKNQKEEFGPFDGCLIVLNIVKNDQTILSKDIEDVVFHEIDKAHAAGWSVLYLFEDGGRKLPDYFDFIEEMDFIRPINYGGRKDTNFNLYPDKRKEQLKDIAEYLRSGFLTFKKNCIVVGNCKIDGTEVFLPPISVF